MSVQVEITKAIIGALRADSALVALLADYTGTDGVFYHVPQGFDAYPYVVLYDIDLDNDDNSAGFRFNGVINIHSWSDNRDISEIGSVMKAVYDTLHHDEFTMVGYTLVEIHQENEIVLRDPDGITLHGVQRFRIMLQTD
jgi:hypothetical protein